MLFFKRKEPPTEINHHEAILFLKQEMGINWNHALGLLDNLMEKDLKHTRIIDDGVLTFQFKFWDIVKHLQSVTGLSEKEIQNRLVDITAARGV